MSLETLPPIPERLIPSYILPKDADAKALPKLQKSHRTTPLRVGELKQGTVRKQGNPGGKRSPYIEIDPALVRNLACIQCTLEEMSFILGINRDSIAERFGELIKEASAHGKKSLRRQQFEIAKTNATMAIFLGKQYLGQRDDSNAPPQYTQIIVERA